MSVDMSDNPGSTDLSAPRTRLLCLILFVLGTLTILSVGIQMMMQQLITEHLAAFAASGVQVARLLSMQSWLHASVLGGLIALTAYFLVLPVLRKAEDSTIELEKARRHDALTGLPEQHYLEEMLVHTLASGRRHGQTVGLLRLDLDGFRQANLKLGHQRCNQILTEVAQRLREDLRGSDYIARLGGDEFCIVVPQVRTVDGLGYLCERIVESVAEVTAESNGTAPITTSIGIAVAWPRESILGDDLLRRADRALADAQRKKGDSWSFDSAALSGPAEHLSLATGS